MDSLFDIFAMVNTTAKTIYLLHSIQHCFIDQIKQILLKNILYIFCVGTILCKNIINIIVYIYVCVCINFMCLKSLES